MGCTIKSQSGSFAQLVARGPSSTYHPSGPFVPGLLDAARSRYVKLSVPRQPATTRQFVS